jgi:type II restriction/modification system DNA methylase subunit YeeA
MWIIDFPPGMTIEQAALYEAPFEYLKEKVKPVRESSRSKVESWWHHERPRPDMRTALVSLSRCIATPTVSKHRLFVWLAPATLPDHQLIVIAKEDDFTFGVLHSRFHELWARGMGTQLREAESGFRYTPSTTFETYPFPDPTPDQSTQIADIAARLSRLRTQWLDPRGQDPAVLKQRTLTNLYNAPPTWLQQLHEELDAAVAAAYGWPADITDEAILEALLALNLERSAAESSEQGALGVEDAKP